jgi:hypothetical protein
VKDREGFELVIFHMSKEAQWPWMSTTTWGRNWLFPNQMLNSLSFSLSLVHKLFFFSQSFCLCCVWKEVERGERERASVGQFNNSMERNVVIKRPFFYDNDNNETMSPLLEVETFYE